MNDKARSDDSRSSDIPSESSADSPAPDATRPVLDGMPSGWQFVYDRIREGHAAAVLANIADPSDPVAMSVLRASSAAVRAFREAYKKETMQGIISQINGLEG